MNIRELKELIKDIPDDMRVVVPNDDHNYLEGWGGLTKAIESIHRGKVMMFEHFEEIPLATNETIIDVLVISCG